MIEIKFLSQEIQNAIYDIAHKYEGFEILDINDLVKSFSENIKIKGGCEFGLENAISDYLLLKNDFSKDGRYYYIIEQCQGDNRYIKHFEDKFKTRKSASIRDKYMKLGTENTNNNIVTDEDIDRLFNNNGSKDLEDMFKDDGFWDK